MEDTKKELPHWQFVWTREGNIWARRNNNSRAVKINTYRALDDVMYSEGERINNF